MNEFSFLLYASLVVNPVLSIVLTKFYYSLKFNNKIIRTRKEVVLLVATTLTILFAGYFFSYLLHLTSGYIAYGAGVYLLGNLLGIIIVLFRVNYFYNRRNLSTNTNQGEDMGKNLNIPVIICSVLFWIFLTAPFILTGIHGIYSMMKKSSMKKIDYYLGEARRTGDISLCDKIVASDSLESFARDSKILCYESVDKEYPNYQKNCTLYDKHGYLEQATEQQTSCIAHKVKDFIDMKNLSIDCGRLNEYPEGVIYRGKAVCEDVRVFLNDLRSVVAGGNPKLCRKFISRPEVLLTSENVDSEPYYGLCLGYFTESEDHQTFCKLVGDSDERSSLLGQCTLGQRDIVARDFLFALLRNYAAIPRGVEPGDGA